MPWKVTVTAWLCQPFASGGRAAGLDCGAVSSYLSGRFAGAVFPATSRQVPGDRRSARVRPAVGRVRGARLEAGGRVVPVEVDGEVVVVPAVRIGGARRCRGRRRRGLVDLERLRDRRRAAVALGGARERRARRVARERDRVAAGRREDDRLRVRHRPVDGDVGRVPAVEPQRSGDHRRHDRRSRVAGDVREAGGARREQQRDDREQEAAACRRTRRPYFVTTNELLPSGRFA